LLLGMEKRWNFMADWQFGTSLLVITIEIYFF